MTMNLSYETHIKTQDFGVVGGKEAWRRMAVTTKERLKASFLPHFSVKYGFSPWEPNFPNMIARILALELASHSSKRCAFIIFNALCKPGQTARRSAKRSRVRICWHFRPRTKTAKIVSLKWPETGRSRGGMEPSPLPLASGQSKLG